MSIPVAIFYLFAGLTIGAGLYILFAKNVLHAVLSLLAVFLSVSGLYVFAGADFLAVTQLVIYVGGVLVLMLFGVMLTSRDAETSYPVSGNIYLFTGVAAGILIFCTLLYAVFDSRMMFVNNQVQPQYGTSVKTIGIGLMTEYVLVFEVAGMLLLIALVGAAFIAGRKDT